MDKTTTGATHTRARRWAARLLPLALIGTGLTIFNAGSAAALRPPNFNAPAGNFVVSNDAFRLRVVAIGTDGVSTSTAAGGDGAQVTTTIPVTPGETLTVFLNEGGGAGGPGSTLPLGEAGGNGGSASGLRRATSNLVVAAGGGGAGGDAVLTAVASAGDGGNTPAASTSSNCGPGADGGDATLPPLTGGGGGGGGQCNSGGAGGTGVASGQPGTSNQGGAGGGPPLAGGGGGGGGGGHFGGGGGGAGVVGVLGGGGGGGGSSFVANGTQTQIAPNTGTPPGSVTITEMVGDTECSDNVDNADPEDVLIDEADPGCHTDGDATNPATYDPTDNNEGEPQCSDNIDNADPEDTLIDELDPGCHSDGNVNNGSSYNPNDNSEVDGAGNTQCSDNVDNADPEDALVDENDPGCHSDGVSGNAASYVPNDNDETDNVAQTQCANGVDDPDPEDTFADENDPGCHTDGNPNNPASYNPDDNNEVDGAGNGEGPAGNATCSDGLDNDGDGLIDAADSDCQGATGGAQSDLIVTIHANKAKVKSGKVVGYTIRVRNGGPDVARNVEVITTLDKGKLIFKDVTGNGCTAPAPGSNVVQCNITTLAPKTSTVFTIEAKTKGGGKAKTTVEAVLTQGEDRAISDNKDREQIRITPRRHKRR